MKLLPRAWAIVAALVSLPFGGATTVGAASIPTAQQQYQFVRSASQGPFELRLVQAPVRAPGAHEVVIRVHATSLNRRDLFVMRGLYPVGTRQSVVPLSDGAGEIVATGSAVTRFKTGNRVAAIFFQNWIKGAFPADAAANALGGGLDGMLSPYVTLNEEGVVAIPSTLSYEEAATLPCAGVTAWNGLFTRGRLNDGDFVLLEGTGGVSLLGLVLAKAAGARPIITSSSDEKLKRTEALGAVGTVNYKTSVDWEKPVLQLTGGVGVQQVLEVGGKDSLPHALGALAPGAHVALIGGLGGFGGEVPVMPLMNGNLTVSGIYVGSREDFEALLKFIQTHHVKPVVDRVYDFKDAPAALESMDKGEAFGKIVIRLAGS